MRIELTTYALRVRCSTPELPGRVIQSLVYSSSPARHPGNFVYSLVLTMWKIFQKLKFHDI